MEPSDEKELSYDGPMDPKEYSLKWNLEEYSTTQQDFLKGVIQGDSKIVSTLFEKRKQEDNLDYVFNKALRISVQEGHRHIVELIVRHGADVDAIDEKGNTPLMFAAKNQFGNIVEFLLHYKASPKIQNKKGQTALLLAVMNSSSGAASGKLDVVESLVENGANVNTQDAKGMTALMHATKKEELVVMTYLIENGASLDIKAFKENTALSFAIFKGSVPCVKLLLDKGAKISKQYDTYIAVVNNQTEILKLLLESVEASELREDLLIISLEKVHVKKEIIKILIDHGEYVSQIDNRFMSTPLLFFARDAEIAEALIRKGAKVNKNNMKGETPLTYLVDPKKICQSKRGVIQVLLDNGADLARDNTRGLTALMKTVMNGNNDLVMALLRAGADVNQVNEMGHETALMFAAERGFTSLVKLLLERGASTEFQTVFSKSTALLYASGKEGTGYEYEDPVVPLSSRISTVQCLLEHGANVHHETHEGSTSLFFATGPEMVEDLVKAGADINKENKRGDTALLVATRQSKAPTVQALLKHGADPNMVTADPNMITKNVKTPLKEALTGYNIEADFDTLECLLEAGAWKTSDNSCCNDILAKLIVITGQVRFVELLIRNGVLPEDVCGDCLLLDVGASLEYEETILDCDIPTFSPFKIALLCGNIEIAQFLNKIWFLSMSDCSPTLSDVMLQLLLDLGLNDSADFLKTVCTPFSLAKLSFLAVSDSLGIDQGREDTVATLGLPVIIQDKLVYKTSYLLGDNQRNNTNSWRGKIIFQQTEEEEEGEEEEENDEVYAMPNPCPIQ